jgi:pimeloyl-ACP methyl ester carboxylesterase
VRRASLLLAVAALAGCGGNSAPRPEGPFGQGADQVWYVQPHGKPRAVVVLLHGLSRRTSLDFEPWLVHLAEQGDEAVFPLYEAEPPDANARDHALAGLKTALDRLGDPKVPIVLVGHSRGGRLAVELAAVMPDAGLNASAVVAIFPGLINPDFEPPTDFTKLDPATKISILVGEADRGVGSAGAVELFERLRAAGFPAQSIVPVKVRSRPGFLATHMSVYDTSKTAHEVFWGRVDRIVDALTSEEGLAK